MIVGSAENWNITGEREVVLHHTGDQPLDWVVHRRGVPKRSRRFQPDVSACQSCRDLTSALSCLLPLLATARSYQQAP